jgi:C4-dicarboxylate-specific signal transduction histidine kinase
MDAGDWRLLWQKGSSFLGRMTASQSHEVTNVLNIINELAGLMDDLLQAGAEGRPVNHAKLREIVGKIAFQVQRGERLVRSINQVAHSADQTVAMVDVRELLERITFIAQRPASLRKTRLETRFPAETLVTETNPLGLQHAVFLGIEVALGAAAEKREIGVEYALSGEGVEISIRSADPMAPGPEATEKLGLLTQLLQALGGRLVTGPSQGEAHRLVLFFPGTPPGRREEEVVDASGQSAPRR